MVAKQSQTHAHTPGLSNRTTAQKYLSATRFLDVTKVMEEDRGNFGPSTLEEKPRPRGLVSSPVISANLVLPSLSKLRLGGGRERVQHPLIKGGRQSEEMLLCVMSVTVKIRRADWGVEKQSHKSFRKFWFFSERSHTVSILRDTEDGQDTSRNSCLLMFLLNKLFLPLLSG